MSLNRGRGRGRGMYLRQNQSREINVPARTPVNNTNDAIKTNKQMNRITINLDLDLETEQWFTQYKNSWNLYKSCPALTNMLHQYLDSVTNSVTNPYEQALRLMYNCLDFKHAKTKSLSFSIMQDFKGWSYVARNNILYMLTTDLKISAFNIVRQQSQFALMKLVADIYELTTDCQVLKGIFLDIIREMIDERQYKEACQCCVLLGLQNNFGIHEFLFPLVLQDKLFYVEDFLTGHRQHQIDLVTYIDSVIGQQISIRSALESYIMDKNIPEAKWEKLCYKPWRKLITRLIKMYKLDPDISPNLNKKRNEGALQFLLNKRFVDNSFGYESWKEMIQEAVKDNQNLQQELVVQISIFGDIKEALMWAHFYQVPREYWPHSVRLLDENPNNDRHQQQNPQAEADELWAFTEATQVTSYHKLDLSQDRIILVDNVVEFEKFIQYIGNVYLIGVDCEWKPTFGVQKSELALMQIATRKNVYILDVIRLAGEIHLWQQLGKYLFNNCDILKLGFSFTSDISVITHSLPHLSFNRHAGFLDVLSLWKQLEKDPKVQLPYEVQNPGLSLGTLVQLCLGRPLDKSDQFSNWEKRPLRQSQLEYAALDAYCLIQVYDVLKTCSETVNFPFEETCYELLNTTKFKKKKKSKPHLSKTKSKEAPKINAQPPSPHFERVSADKISFVCDTMLQGLGKALRRIGIDTYILANNEDHKECIRHYQNEHRYVLTRGQTFNMLMGYTVTGHCFNVETDDVDEQVKLVLEYFNINVTKDHVFSRCQSCNSNSFVKISKSTMNALAIEEQKAKQIRFNSYELVDEATGFSSEDDCDDAGPPLSYTRKWEICTEDKIDLGLSLTRNGAKIQVDSIPPGVLDKYDLFYVCEDCGKVYWDGSHFEKVLSNRLQGIVI